MSAKSRARSALIGMMAAWVASGAVGSLSAQDLPEVRQLVTFKFRPNASAEAESIVLESLLPIYSASPALLRFRALKEAESPEPLDLVLVTSVRGLAGMDALNAQLREPRPGKNGIGLLYGKLSALSEWHHDQFVEMLAPVSTTRSTPKLWVFEFVRTTPGEREGFRQIVESFVAPWERDRTFVKVSETGRALIADGWDFIRFLGFDSLADYHAYRTSLQAQPFGLALDGLVAVRKILVLRPDDKYAVR
ncbi:MAG: hypothetical protein U0Q12_17235 [Vicinamibacterales bacterium]